MVKTDHEKYRFKIIELLLGKMIQNDAQEINASVSNKKDNSFNMEGCQGAREILGCNSSIGKLSSVILYDELGNIYEVPKAFLGWLKVEIGKGSKVVQMRGKLNSEFII